MAGGCVREDWRHGTFPHIGNVKLPLSPAFDDIPSGHKFTPLCTRFSLFLRVLYQHP